MGGMTSLLLLLWAAVTASAAVDVQKRIIGGKQCGPNERQYHVKITDLNGELICGSSLVDKQWILTAAHCWEWDMLAVVGVHSGTAETMRITAPPEMFADSNYRVHDIMLLKLPKPINNITPVKLPACKIPPTIGTKVQIAGYAATAPDAQNIKVSGESKTLQCADIELVDCQVVLNTLKKNDLKAYNVQIYQHIICGQTRGVDTCPGDSGGGMIFNNMIYGVHSSSGTTACTTPAVFMNVCKYEKWIKKKIKKPLFGR